MDRLNKVTIRGFRSIRLLENFEPGKLTVLIGPNGAGKSNFVEFFRMLRNMVDESFQKYAQTIGPETLFFMGPKKTPKVVASLEFGQNLYEFDLQARAAGGVFIGQERVQYTGGKGLRDLEPLGPPSTESRLKNRSAEPARTTRGKGVTGYVYDAVASWTVYHVHDTSQFAPMRGWGSITNNRRLSDNAGNLAAVLLAIKEKHEHVHERIRDTIRLAAPFFDDFVLRPETRGQEEQVRLEWTQKGSQEPFQPTVLSDGTLRFIALVTALLQPYPPSTILIDEPELGLHPYAINLLGETIRSRSDAPGAQVIVSTQSPQLLDSFQPSEIVVVERSDGESVFRRLEESALQQWLSDYSLGELWLKNLLGGRPGRD